MWSGQKFDTYRKAVEIVINKWTGLRLAVENGMGGASGINVAREMIDYIAKFSFNDDVDANDVADALEQIMEQEFCTFLEDDSPKEIGYALQGFRQFCKDGKFDNLEKELSQLPPGPLWLKEGLPHNKFVKNCSSSEEEDEAMDESAPAVASTSGATTTTIVTEENSEWIQVKARKKRS